MLQSMGLQRVGHDWETEQQQHANDIQIYISNSDLSPELQTLIPISSLTFQFVCLEGILNQFQDQIP